MPKYIVVSGDTLSEIAQRNGIKISDITITTKQGTYDLGKPGYDGFDIDKIYIGNTVFWTKGADQKSSRIKSARIKRDRMEGSSDGPRKRYRSLMPSSKAARSEDRLASSPIGLCDPFHGQILEITSVEAAVPTTNKAAKVVNPYWRRNDQDPSTDNYIDNDYSTHPLAVKVRASEAFKMSIKIEITKVEGLSGEATVTGTLGSAIWKGNLPLHLGEHQINVELTSAEVKLQKHVGDINWEADVANCDIKQLGTTRVELYGIVDDPEHIFIESSLGRPVEALRFLYEDVGVSGKDAENEIENDTEIISTITTYLHSGHGLGYDVYDGRSKYLYYYSNTQAAFMLSDYLEKSNGNVVNCYDQASAVQVLSYIIGLAGSKIFVNNFGFINRTILVGNIESNNPFHKGNGNRVIVDKLDPDRTSFWNHEFYKLDKSNKIFDACAKPHLGTESYIEYMMASVETGVIWAYKLPGGSGDSPVDLPSIYPQEITWWNNQVWQKLVEQKNQIIYLLVV